jgi:hypothetical protein
MAAILLMCFIILAWVQVFYHKRFGQLLRAPFSKRFINQLIRDGNLFRERIAIALGVVYFLAFSLFIYHCIETVLPVSFGRFSGIRLFLGMIFKTRETTGNYLLNLLIFLLLSGPVLLAGLVWITYLGSGILLFILIAIFVMLMLFRLIRGFFIGMELRKFSYLFLFVYLCSLEILPLLVLIKILLNITKATGA